VVLPIVIIKVRCCSEGNSAVTANFSSKTSSAANPVKPKLATVTVNRVLSQATKPGVPPN